MNTLKLNNKRNFVLTLIILAGCITSCEKETISEPLGSLEITPIGNNYSEGGDEEEDPIIQGGVVDQNNIPISSAKVELVDSGSGVVKDVQVTDVNGKFLMTTSPGNYRFEVTVAGVKTKTANFNINQSLIIVIQV